MKIQLQNLTDSYIIINSIKQKLPPRETATFAVESPSGELTDNDILGLERNGDVKLTIIKEGQKPQAVSKKIANIKTKVAKIKAAKAKAAKAKAAKTVVDPEEITNRSGSGVTVMTLDGPKKGHMVNSIANEANVSIEPTPKKCAKVGKKASTATPLIEDVDAEEPHPAFIDNKK